MPLPQALPPTNAQYSATAPAGVRATLHMVGVAQTAALLNVDNGELLALINRGELAAYRLGEQIRFRYRDVESLASRRAIAA